MTLFNIRKRGSSMALAIALATGSAVVATAVFPAEAHAQRKKKKNKGGGEYSQEFIAAFQPLNEALTQEGVDAAAYKPQLEALVPLANSPDEKNNAGILIYNTAVKLNDQPLQLTGMELMLASGKTDIAQVGRFNFIAYQLANAQQDFPKARKFLQEAINRNFTTDTISLSDLRIAMAESYFSGNEFVEGLAFLKQAIEAQKASGVAVDEQWYRRGLTVAYNNKIVPQVYEFAGMWIADYPSPANWRDVVNLTRNLNQFEAPQTLDLLRLSRAAGALNDKQDYILYVESADARRLPKEVKEIIEEAYAKNAVSRDDIYVADALTTANGRIASDRADLPALERDADASSAQLRTVMAAANAFYSYGDYAKAARFYEKALGMPGVDAGEALNRLGMAQVGLGDYAAAQETFAKVEGPRAPIATIWAAYAAEKAGPASDGPSLGELMSASN
ncbi:tol-pal system YbgF family protein [Erythrobacter sp. THAF29]|uniref:tetratricopeptide repeat protein n=1 Tax=Erythrobacter sp. THAF29 TaxID=2587851 RepID=UPI001268616F|nr:hypothetical protein [Erythrobacter sp. THAF29]QFT77937.1 Tetratricopeptide repeat protein [Erythrobacter sp. THAF29]